VFNNYDPYDKIEELERDLALHAEYLQQFSEQLNQQSVLIERITDAMKDISKAISWLHIELEDIKGDERDIQ
jgi:uncharacterized coiled-coil protein SlyX